MSGLDARRLASLRPAAPSRAADTSAATLGTVMEVDAVAAEVRVTARGSEGSWVPAVAGRYKPGGVCQVIRDPFAGGRSALVLPVDVYPPVVLGTLTALNETAGTATVSVLGATGVVLPYLQAAYTVGGRVWVTLNDWATPVRVDGPSGEPSATTVATAPTVAAAPMTAQVTVAVAPQWSGTYRHVRSAWDRWNVTRYGGRSTLYQGDGFGSGPLTGLATYGDQLVNLGAASIDRVQVMLRGVGLSGAAGPATVQGSPHAAKPAGAPSSSGDTATGDGWVDLPASMHEPMRTGGVKALALVGANYWAVAGAGNADGMVLAVTLTRPV